MPGLSIGQLAAKAEINASTLRYYESVGLLPDPERKNNQRRYDEGVLDRINFIKVAQQTGFSIQEIAILLEGFEPGDSLIRSVGADGKAKTLRTRRTKKTAKFDDTNPRQWLKLQMPYLVGLQGENRKRRLVLEERGKGMINREKLREKSDLALCRDISGCSSDLAY